MRDPVRILVKNDELTLEGIRQFYIAIDREEWKVKHLFQISVMFECKCIEYLE